MFQEVTYRITGVSPLLMNRPALVDPLGPEKKALAKLTKKGKNKSDEDERAISDVHFAAGYYSDEKGRAVIPGVNWEACIVRGGVRFKLGKMIKSSVMVADDSVLTFAGPKAIDARMKDPACSLRCRVKNGTMKTRPLFRDWSCLVVVMVDTEILDIDQVTNCLVNAGRLDGICDWRPRYGRFNVEVAK